MRKFAPKTQHDYVQRVKNFAAFLGKGADNASSRKAKSWIASDVVADHEASIVRLNRLE